MAASKVRQVVVTGAGSGIGKALTLALASRGVRVIAVGRRSAPLDALVKLNVGAGVLACPADLSTSDVRVNFKQSQGITAVVDKVKSTGQTLDFLVHNAGSIGPIAPLADIEVDDVRKTFEINFFAPLALTKALLPSMTKPGGRILHISSGAAVSAYPSWTTYCTSKAALQMLWRSNNVELGSEGILTGSVRPGIVATPMQGEIREVDESKFPLSKMFKGFHEGMEKPAGEEMGVSKAGARPPEGALDTPENCAFFLQWLLLSTGDDEFRAEEWDIREESYMHRWADVPKPEGAEAGAASGGGGDGK